MNGHGLWKVRSWSLVLAPWLDKNTGTIHKDKEFRRINRYGEVGRNNLSMRYCESLEQVTVLATWGLPTFVICLVVRSYLTLCNPMDYSPPGFFVHEVLQARMLEWASIYYSRGSSWSRDWIQVSCFAGRFFTTVSPGKPTKLDIEQKQIQAF